MTIETAIEYALFGRVRSLALTGAPPVAWPNRSFTPPATYVRVDHLPNRTSRLFIGSTASHLRQGILQLTAVTPLNGGPEPASELAGAIAAGFPPDLALYRAGVKVRVQRVPDVMPPEKTDTSWTVRVDVYYDCLSAPRVGTASLATTMGALLLDGIGGVRAQGILAATLGDVVVTSSGFVFDVDTWAWRNAVIANGGTVSLTRLVIVDIFIRAEKAAGNWALTDDYHGFWAENAIQALTSLKQHRLAVAVNSPTFTADRDYTFNGTTSYIDTGFVANSHAVVMAASSVHVEAYERTNVNGSTAAVGVNSGSGRLLSMLPRNGATMFPAPNMVGASYTLAVATSAGLSQGGRTGGTTSDIYGAKNGAGLVQATAPSGLGATLPIHSVFLGASNNSGTAAQFRPAALGFVAYGAALDSTKRLARYTNVQAWATAVGAQV